MLSRYSVPFVRVLVLTGLFVLAACAAKTRYSGTPVGELSDIQLVEEFESVLSGLGVEMDRTMYLMAIRPEPAYVLTSSTTTFSGSVRANYNSYSMPVGYGSSTYGSVSGTVTGSASTRYTYTDVNTGAQLGNTIALAISRARQAAYRRRGEEVLDEYERRVTARREETEQVIEEFFASNPEMESRRMLMAAVAPWVAAETDADGIEILERTKDVIDDLSREPGLSGRWYGIFTQTVTDAEDEVYGFTEFLHVDLEETEDGAVEGTGMLGSGERLEILGELDGSELNASVANVTSGINVVATAITAETQIAGDFAGFGLGQQIDGTVLLLR